ncbi:MAG: YHS domain-containing protein [Phycisphaerae bacterium]|nr:YHS domain-containing protein [Phycisphaerae bacterium]
MRYPALVLLGPDGREVFRYVGKANTDRISFDRFAEKIAELSRNDAARQYNLADSGLALQGYDAVSYFDGGKPLRGSEEFTTRYRGVTYRFASRENRGKFAKDPAKYVPAYGGWCATAMAEGRLVEVDPMNFKITGGRLFLFYKGWLGNALKDWNKDEKRLTARADSEWRRIAPKDQSGTRE